ncbi:proton-coupled folate transporter-like isoform X2 [Leguminivora glycinivorella]|nr:proton-coupled folate transporter-like isoform X2 [Leguminivora glycinivorella]XP_047986350.1 proton-coupled folate transporter-like isoform X2 [Leguminivora glycinivorella]
MSDQKTTVEEKPLKDNKNEFKTKTLYEKICYIKQNITVEPIFAGLVIGSMLSRIAIQNLNLDKTCRVKQDYGDFVCDELIERKGNHTEQEGEIQKIISQIETWRSVIQTAVPTLLVIFMGAWSDRTGNRKFCILLPVAGEILVCLSNILSTYFFDEIPVEVTMLLESIFPAVTGGWVMMFLGVFSYISDITTAESRTFRVGLVNLCMTCGILVGTSLSGFLLKFGGYYGVFIITGILNLAIATYGCIYLKKNTKPDHDVDEKKDPMTVKYLITVQKETASVVTRKREGNIRLKIILTLIVVAMAYGPNHGESKVLYLFLRYRLNWDAVKYSLYSTCNIMTHSLGALFSISVFSKQWGWDDSVLCLISIVSKMVGSVFIAFVATDFQMYMVPFVEILNATTFTSLRSMASKLVPSQEMGKMNSLFSLVETLAALAFDPTYTLLYGATMKTFTGAVFLYSACNTLPAISILIWFFRQHRLEVKEKKTEIITQKLDAICTPTPEKSV